MASFPTAFPLLRQQVSNYSQCASDESWKQAHEEAMACRDLEALLQVGIGLYRSIEKLAPAPVAGDGSAAQARTGEVESEVLDLFDWWLRPCNNVDAHIRRFESRGYEVDGAKAFRSAWDEVRTMSGRLPTTWRGQKVCRESDLPQIDFPFPPEPE